MKRILWNRRPTGPTDPGDIDEIVADGATVHVEQMHGRCWWLSPHCLDDDQGAFDFGGAA